MQVRVARYIPRTTTHFGGCQRRGTYRARAGNPYSRGDWNRLRIVSMRASSASRGCCARPPSPPQDLPARRGAPTLQSNPFPWAVNRHPILTRILGPGPNSINILRRRSASNRGAYLHFIFPIVKRPCKMRTRGALSQSITRQRFAYVKFRILKRPRRAGSKRLAQRATDNAECVACVGVLKYVGARTTDRVLATNWFR